MIRDNSKELTEILQEKPLKFFKLDIFSQICINSLTNKIKTFLNVFPQMKIIDENLKRKEILHRFYELCFFIFHYKRRGFST